MAVDNLRAFWAGMGAKVEIMTPEHHDLVLAITSHLPHLIAYTIVGTADELAQVTSSRGDEILRRRLSRFHPHRGVRPDDVARCVPQQPGGRAGNARHASTRISSKLTRAIRRGDGEALFEHLHPHPRHPPRHRRDRPGFGSAGFRPAASAVGQEAGVSPAVLTVRRGLVARMSVAISGAVLEESRIRFAHPGYETIPALHGMMREDRVPHHEPRRHRLGVNRRSRRSDAEIAIGMVERVHSGLVEHVLRRDRRCKPATTRLQQNVAREVMVMEWCTPLDKFGESSL